MNRKWDCSLQSVLRFSNYFSLNKVWNKLLWFLPTLQFPLCQLHFCLPFSQPFQKIFGDQVAEIQNEKDRMKDRRSKRRKEGRAQKLEKTFCRMQPMGIFSAHWKGPIRLSSQPRLCSGSSFLFPFVCSQTQSTIWKWFTWLWPQLWATTTLPWASSEICRKLLPVSASRSLPTKQTADAATMGKCPSA